MRVAKIKWYTPPRRWLAAISVHHRDMSDSGTIQNGVVILPPSVCSSEGAEVEIIPRELTPDIDPLLSAVLKLVKPRPHLPADYTRNHGDYVDCEPD